MHYFYFVDSVDKTAQICYIKINIKAEIPQMNKEIIQHGKSDY